MQEGRSSLADLVDSVEWRIEHRHMQTLLEGKRVLEPRRKREDTEKKGKRRSEAKLKSLLWPPVHRKGNSNPNYKTKLDDESTSFISLAEMSM